MGPGAGNAEASEGGQEDQEDIHMEFRTSYDELDESYDPVAAAVSTYHDCHTTSSPSQYEDFEVPAMMMVEVPAMMIDAPDRFVGTEQM